MNIADYEDLLDRLGEDISGWPVPQQQAAAELLQSSPEARTALAQARLLRRALSAPPVRAEAGLTERIMQAVRQGSADPAAAGPSVRETTTPATSPSQTESDANTDDASKGSSRLPRGVAGGER